MQKIINIDATILNTVQTCIHKTYLNFHENLKSNAISQSIEEGLLIHAILEVYYGIKGNCANLDSKLWQELLDAGFIYRTDMNWDELLQFCCEVGRFVATRMQNSPEDLEETIYQFLLYAEYYKSEPWRPLAVEEVGSRILFEDDDWKIIYTCKTDLFAENGSIRIPWDHKSGKRKTSPKNTSNQFRGTCFVLGTNHLMINKIGFQKSLPVQERFQRDTLHITDSVLEEWQKDTIYWAKLYWNHIESDYWPRNLTGCDKYSGCIYRPICEKDPRHRLYEIEQNYHVGEEWDVAKVLEDE